MKEITLKVKTRDTGKQNSKAYRRNGLVPGIFYSRGGENVNILTDPLSLRPIVYTSLTRIVELVVNDEEVRRCVLKKVDFDPVTDEIVHFDLQGINTGEKLTVEVPFILKGQAIGVRNGGLLAQSVYRTKVTCLPKDLPESLEVDISNLKIGESIYVKDMALENVEIFLPDDAIVCSIVKPRVAGDDDEPNLEETNLNEDEEGGEESSEE
jgi:large subunit ribosomal protein L25